MALGTFGMTVETKPLMRSAQGRTRFGRFLFAHRLALCSLDHMPRQSARIPLPPEFVVAASRYNIAPDVLALRVLAAWAADPPEELTIRAAACEQHPRPAARGRNRPV
jgi:hypothetical protein